MECAYDNLKTIFKLANRDLINLDKDLFETNVSERTLCGALMLRLLERLKQTIYSSYYVDVEYNRNRGGKLKTLVKTVQRPKLDIIKINCDLIVHSRGKCVEQDNLIAIEMKKSNRSKSDKDKDRERLRCLTKDSFDDMWSFDGKSLPEHVCRYIIGVYYEINYTKRQIEIEYYYKGKLKSTEIMKFELKNENKD